MIYVNSSRSSSGGFGGIGCLIFGALFLVGMFYVLKGLYTFIWWAAPAFFVLALIINWKVVANTGKWIFRLFQNQPFTALIVTALSIYLFPLLTFFWFLSAIGTKRITRMQEEFGKQWGGPFGSFQNPSEPETEYTEFEELESRPKGKPTIADDADVWPPEPEKKQQKPDNPYEDMFK